MNKGELINEIAKKAGLSKKDATNALNTTLEAIIKNTKKGVAIAGFGSFVVSKRKARKGINPQTGEATQWDILDPAPDTKRKKPWGALFVYVTKLP